MNGSHGLASTIHTFRKRAGGHDGINTSSSLNGAFIQVPEGCLIRACEAETGEMAVLTTFAVESIDETLRKVVEMGGRIHSYVKNKTQFFCLRMLLELCLVTLSCLIIQTDVCAFSLTELGLTNLRMMADLGHSSAGIWDTLLDSLIAKEICMGSGLHISRRVSRT